MIVDTYCHCGVDKYRPVHEVLRMMEHCGVSRAVLTQHLGQFDNSYIEACVESRPEVFAGVVMIDPESPRASAELKRAHELPGVRGVRMTTAMMPTAMRLASGALELGLNLVLYCPDGTAPLEALLPRLAPGPGMIVVSHLGSPIVKDGVVERGSQILRLAEDPRVGVALSGPGMACPPPHSALRQLVQEIVKEFGSERVAWGSNFPVCGGAPEVLADLKLLKGNAWGLDPEAMDDLLGRTANRLWFGEQHGGQVAI